jgi:hypothetical protein
MKKSTITILAAALAALMLVVFVLRFESARQPPNGSLCAPGITQRMSALEITHPGGETAKFMKTGAGWTLAYPFAYSAAEQEIETAAQMLCGAQVSDVLSTSPDAAKLFGLNPENAVKLAFYDSRKNQLLELSAGKESPSLESFFGRNAAGEVREISGIARAALARPSTEWLDKTIYRSAAITGFEWKRGKEVWKAARTGDKWFLDYKGKRTEITGDALTKKVSALAAMLSNFQAEKVLPSAGKDSNPKPFKPDFTLTVSSPNAQPAVLEISTKEDSARRLRLHYEQRVIFTLPDWRATTLLITPKELKL